MFGFKNTAPEQEPVRQENTLSDSLGFRSNDASESTDVRIINGLKTLSAELDKGAGNFKAVIELIEKIDADIKNLSPVQQSKISLYWNGGVVGMKDQIKTQMSMFSALPAITAKPILSSTFGSFVAPMKTNVLNTLKELS